MDCVPAGYGGFAVIEFHSAKVERYAPGSAVLTIEVAVDKPTQTALIYQCACKGETEYWPYVVLAAELERQPLSSLQTIRIPLLPENVGTRGVEIIGDTLHEKIDVILR